MTTNAGVDADIHRWILEFILRQPIDHRLLNSLINILHFPIEDSSIKRAFLLRRIEFEITNPSMSENVLAWIEQIEELNFQEGIKEHSDALKAAYCAVAVACTVNFLKINGDDGKYKYFDAVKRIWRAKIGKLENVEGVGLASEELWGWKDKLEAAVWEEGMRENVLKKSEGLDAVEAVRAYIQEEKSKKGPSFLELVANSLMDDDQQLRSVLGVASTGNAEVRKGKGLYRQKLVVRKRTGGATPRGPKIADPDNSGVDLASKRYNLPPIREVHRVQEALASSSLELQAAVKDPLLDALHLAETVLSGMTRKDINNVPLEESCDRANPVVSTNPSSIAQANGEDKTHHCHGQQEMVPKPGLMMWNSTATTFQWDDSIDGLPDDSADRRDRPELPTPKKRIVSPLKINEVNKFSRRKIKRWSTLEEDTLRTGVNEYRTGNWKAILNTYPDIFKERTEVDLKDKWRNMTRY